MNYESDSQGSNPNVVVDFPESKTIEAQASEWLAKLDADTPSKEDLQGFKRWVNEDDAHRKAFEEIIEFWDGMNVLTQVILPRETTLPDHTRNSQHQYFRSTPVYLVSGAFAVVLAIAIVLMDSNFYDTAPLIYVTKVGEQQTIELPDSSIVLLNTDSRLEVDYNEQRRRLMLVRGEAHFDVFHTADRPFNVYAGKGLVRAVGTAFTVHVRKVDVEVVVTEGVVEIIDAAEPIETHITFANSTALPNSTTEPPISGSEALPDRLPLESGILVEAGNTLMYDRDTLSQVKLVVTHQVEKELSWREGILVFSGEPLEKVVDEMSRYTSLKIIIPERRTRELKVGGIFKVGDTESFFEALRDGFDIHVKEISDNVVYLISSENR